MTEFKIGDRVRRILLGGYGIEIGDIGIIESIVSDGLYKYFNVRLDKNNVLISCNGGNYLELVTEALKEKKIEVGKYYRLINGGKSSGMVRTMAEGWSKYPIQKCTEIIGTNILVFEHVKPGGIRKGWFYDVQDLEEVEVFNDLTKEEKQKFIDQITINARYGVMNYKITGEKMELNEMSKENLLEAKKQCEEERASKEVLEAKRIYQGLINQLEDCERNIKKSSEIKKDVLEKLKAFGKR